MKKSSIIVCFFLMVMVLASCNNETSIEHTTPEKKGRLVIDLGSTTYGSRSAIPLSAIDERITAFGVQYTAYVYNDSGATTSKSTGDTLEVVLLPGTYNVVVVVRISPSDGAAWLYAGSGYIDDVEIVPDQETSTTIELYPFDITIDAPDEVKCGSKYTVEAGFNSRNPHVYVDQLILNGVSSADPNDSSSIENSEKKTDFTASFSRLAGSAELTDQKVFLQTSGVYIKIKDDTYSDVADSIGNIGIPLLQGTSSYPIEDSIDFVLPPKKTGLLLSFHWND